MAPERLVGKTGRCPRCNSTVQILADPDQIDLVRPKEELRLKDQPSEAQDYRQPKPPWDQDPQDQAQSPQTVSGRIYPWPLDILLYPANTPGLINIGIFWALDLLARLFSLFRMPLLLLLGGRWAYLLVDAFLVYYLAECVRDSTTGQTRAVDNIASPPGVWDAMVQIYRVIGALALTLGPAALYELILQRLDTTFFVLIGLGIFCLPMLLLSMILFDSISGFNPLYWLPAILRTLPHYLGLVLGLASGFALVQWVGWLLRTNHLGLLSPPVTIYGLMILAHLLGRFYFRYEKRIGWDT